MAGVLRQLGLLFGAIGLIAVLLPLIVPLTLLRLIPLITSTVSLMWAADEYMFLVSWLPESYRDQAQALLPLWFATWGRMATYVLFGSFSISIGSAIANIRTFTEASPASKWYWAGLFFVVEHFAYGPKAVGLLAAIKKPAPQGNPTESMRQWISMHLTRVVTADAPAFLSFAAAVLNAVEAVA